MPDAIIAWVAVAAIAAPTLAAAALGSAVFLFGSVGERVAHRTVMGALGVSLACVVFAAGSWWTRGRDALDLELGTWFHAGGYHFPLGVRLDVVSVAFALTVVALSLLVGRFSIHHLHREPGYARFFALYALAAGGLLCIALSNGYDQLFVGWECVGLSSIFLVGFFHERPGPPLGALRVLSTYRICDLGLLTAGVLLHRELGSGEYERAFEWAGSARFEPALGALVVLALLLSATGKSALFPVSGWLPRAMEGPTASSALFYGGLSIHAGAFLLLRSAPLLLASPLASAVVVLLGALTAVHAAMVGRVQFDAKGQLAYATLGQVGLIVVEIGLGLPRLALAHLVAHAFLRAFQLLRAPNVVRDAREMGIALGRTRLPQEGALDRALPPRLSRWLYRLALERFFLDVVIERVVTRVLEIARAAGRIEDWVVERPSPLRAPARLTRATEEEP